MNDLPITSNKAPAKAGGQASVGSSTSQPDNQEFGNLLARQLNDATPADAEDAATGTPAARGEPHKRHAKPGSALPAETAASADMLNALLAQPAQAETVPAAAGRTDALLPAGAKSAASAALEFQDGQLAATEAGNPPAAALQAAQAALAGSGQPAASATAEADRGKFSAPGESKAAPQGKRVASADQLNVAASPFPATAAKSARQAADAKNPPAISAEPGLPATPAQLLAAAGAMHDTAPAGKRELADKLTTLKTGELPQPASTTAAAPHSNEFAATLQQLNAPATPASPPASAHTLHTPLLQPGWSDEFGQKITWLTTQQNHSAELHLNPPQLGPLDVVLKLHGDQASAVFSSPHAAVRDAIEQALPRLREMLADSGITLGNATVNDQAAQRNQEQASRDARAAGSRVSAIDADMPLLQETPVAAIRRRQGLVDTFV